MMRISFEDPTQTEGYRDFDLPVIHLPEDQKLHYVPDYPDEPGLDARKDTLPWNVLIAKQQLIGSRVAGNMLYMVDERQSLEHTARFLAASALNTAWYSFARNADVMRRRLKLPDLTSSNPDWRPDSAELKRNAIEGTKEADWYAHRLFSAFKNRSPRAVDFSTEYGRTVGNTALTIAALDLGDTVHKDARVTNFMAQDMARERAKTTLLDARALVKEIGSYASLAQLANPNSDLSVYLRHNSPAQSRDAFNLVLEEGVEYGRTQPELTL